MEYKSPEKYSDQDFIAVSTEIGDITDLDLHNFMEITDEGIAAITGKLPRLKKLSLHRCKNITVKALVSFIKSCDQLEELDLQYLFKKNNEPIALASACLNLKRLSVRNANKITDEDIKKLAIQFPDLKDLCFHHCELLTEKSFTYLTKYCKKLVSLYICSSNKISNLRGECLKEVRYIGLTSGKEITDDALRNLAIACPNIQFISLSYCPKITSKGTTTLIQTCPNLIHLELFKCKISERDLSQLESMAPRLKIRAYRGLKAYSEVNEDFSFDYYKEIPENNGILDKIGSRLEKSNQRSLTLEKDVTYSKQYFENLSSDFQELNFLGTECSDVEIGTIIKKIPDLCSLAFDNILSNLESLEIGVMNHLLNLEFSFTSISDKGIDILTQGTPNLQFLTLEFCEKLSDKALESIAENCPNLVSLEIDVGAFTQQGIISLVERCSQLVWLSVEHCDNIRNEGLEKLYLLLSERYPHLGFSLH